jgi:hypothetical protein
MRCAQAMASGGDVASFKRAVWAVRHPQIIQFGRDLRFPPVVLCHCRFQFAPTSGVSAVLFYDPAKCLRPAMDC